MSPRGGVPGFVKVLGPSHLAIPDLSGNNLLDTLTNVVRDGRVGLLFTVPGKDETLRVNGRALDRHRRRRARPVRRRRQAPEGGDRRAGRNRSSSTARRRSGAAGCGSPTTWAALADAPDGADILVCQSLGGDCGADADPRRRSRTGYAGGPGRRVADELKHDVPGREARPVAGWGSSSVADAERRPRRRRWPGCRRPSAPRRAPGRSPRSAMRNSVALRLQRCVLAREHERVDEVLQAVVVEDRAQVERHVAHDRRPGRRAAARVVQHLGRVGIRRPPCGARSRTRSSASASPGTAASSVGPQVEPALAVHRRATRSRPLASSSGRRERCERRRGAARAPRPRRSGARCGLPTRR